MLAIAAAYFRPILTRPTITTMEAAILFFIIRFFFFQRLECKRGKLVFITCSLVVVLMQLPGPDFNFWNINTERYWLL